VTLSYGQQLWELQQNHLQIYTDLTYEQLTAFAFNARKMGEGKYGFLVTRNGLLPVERDELIASASSHTMKHYHP
jgi:hypothetical protein